MKFQKKSKILLAGFLVVFAIIGCILLLPIARQLNNNMNGYATQRAYRSDYTLHTTPLRKEVIEEICTKLEIKDASEHCQPDAIVYAPDFFDDIKTYFESVPDQEKTYTLVQNKLGNYLVFCNEPNPDGNYRCRYDLRADNRYPIFFKFDKNNFYYEVIATIGGS